jgi:hypothetical protein
MWFWVTGGIMFAVLVFIVYVWPATARSRRAFLIAMTLSVLIVALYWSGAILDTNGTNPADGVGTRVELTARWTFSLYAIAGVFLGTRKQRAVASGEVPRAHGWAVLVGAILPPVIVLPLVWF